MQGVASNARRFVVRLNPPPPSPKTRSGIYTVHRDEVAALALAGADGRPIAEACEIPKRHEEARIERASRACQARRPRRAYSSCGFQAIGRQRVDML